MKTQMVILICLANYVGLNSLYFAYTSTNVQEMAILTIMAVVNFSLVIIGYLIFDNHKTVKEIHNQYSELHADYINLILSLKGAK